MFKKLRNRLVLINVVITTLILIFAFTTIYLVMQNSSVKRPLPPGEPDFSQSEMRNIKDRVHTDRKESMKELLWLLIVIGVIVEIAVVVISYRYAEIAIQPVQKAYESQKLFIANASHEIKTPLAAISANLEAAEINNNHWINNVSREVQKLDSLNQDLLELAKADSVTAIQNMEAVKVDEVIREEVENFEARLKAKSIKKELILDKKMPKVILDKKSLQQVLEILLDNAIKYGEKKVSVAYDGQNITISNDGIGIPEEKIGRVFERFYQVDKTSEGSGLGLAIAQIVAENNNWTLSVSSKKNETSFTLRLK